MWSYNIIRPNAINEFAPHGKYIFVPPRDSADQFPANGMSEVLTIIIYMLICRELNQPATFPGNEYF
jgi:hypothetical protein